MIRLVVLEGPRGVGKTSVARLLRDTVSGATLINFTGFSEDGEAGLGKVTAYYEAWFAALGALHRESSDYTILCDRFFTSEQVYAPYYKDYSFTDSYHRLLDRLSDIAGSVLYVQLTIRDRDILHRRLQRDKVPFGRAAEGVEESLRQQEGYDGLWEGLNRHPAIRTLRVETDNRTPDQTAAEIRALLSG